LQELSLHAITIALFPELKGSAISLSNTDFRVTVSASSLIFYNLLIYFSLRVPLHFYSSKLSDISSRLSIVWGKGVYGFLTGCKGQALRVFEKIFLFPSVPAGERICFKKP
jgi:hypothetical protein